MSGTSDVTRARAVTVVKPALKRLDNRLPWALLYRGKRVECPCCRGRFRRMRAYHGRPNAKCPGCGSLERHRILWLYLLTRTPLFSERLSVLHFAAEPALEERLRRLSNLDYKSADLEPSHPGMLRVDITDIPFPDASFDVVICNHVLEYVPDDRQAMAEVRRVLRPDGHAVMQHPIDEDRAESYEDAARDAPEFRSDVYGREPVRIYGRDFRERLEAAGFVVERHRFVEELPEETVRKHALRRVGGRQTGEDIHHLWPADPSRGVTAPRRAPDKTGGRREG